MWGAPDWLSSAQGLQTLARLNPELALLSTLAYAKAVQLKAQYEPLVDPCGGAYQRGRQFGRDLSTAVAILETASGATLIVGSVIVGPPLDLAAGVAGGGAGTLPAFGAAVAVNIAVLEAGGALAVHGVGVLARNAGNPVPNVSYATGVTGSELPRPKYTSRSHQHVAPRHHGTTAYRGKSKFVPGEGGQSFADEVVEKGTLTRQADGRLRYDADLGRTVGTRGEARGRAILDPKTGEVITQFPQH